jgi:AcrR family transcriptional regulator
MEIRRDTADKKREVIRICLEVFKKKGLINTTSRDLSAALDLQNAGIYYYFKSKDELVVACAEEAAVQLETQLMMPLKSELTDLDKAMVDLQKRCDGLAPNMKFLAQAFTVDKYHKKLLPCLTAMSERYKKYAQTFAEILEKDLEEIEPLVYIGITAATNYMIFGENSYIKPQFDLIKRQIKTKN